MYLFHFISLLIMLFHKYALGINITELAFGEALPYRPAAFGDFNSDKLTDLFILHNEDALGTTLHILLSSNEPPLLHKTNISCKFPNKKIQSVVPADFDGDGAMDVMVIILNADKKYEGHVLWGDLFSIDCKLSDTPVKLSGQPLLLDYNGDMIADLFGEDEHGNRTVWFFSEHRNVPSTLKEIGPPLRMPSTHAFVDLDGDMAADIWIGANDHFEIAQPGIHGMIMKENVTYPKIDDKEVLFIGQTAFGDFDLDGDIDILLPVCSTTSCTDGRIFVYDMVKKQWLDMKINLIDAEEKQWYFLDTSKNYGLYTDTLTLRVGDYNLDGYPDVLVTLLAPSGEPQVVLLENSECKEACDYPRTLVPKWSLLADWKQSVMGTFFDFEEDGSLDIILVQKIPDGTYRMGAFRNSKEYDAMFVKVLVATGRCLDDCVHHTLPYGTNQPGASMRYAIITGDGATQYSWGSQLSQSAHMVLQLPYTVFGLGRNWNFVETLEVGLPLILNSTLHTRKNTRTFTQIIPNSQLIVIPYPPDQPSLWVNKLFITPSKALKLTAGALIATCLFVAAIIGVLHYKERQQDRREKLQESQRFHFDAM